MGSLLDPSARPRLSPCEKQLTEKPLRNSLSHTPFFNTPTEKNRMVLGKPQAIQVSTKSSEHRHLSQAIQRWRKALGGLGSNTWPT